MKTIFNVGKLHSKSYYNSIIRDLDKFNYFKEKLTGADVFYNKNCQIVFNCYGGPLVWDVLSSLKPKGKLVLVGAFGSIIDDIKMGDILVPNKIETNHFSNFIGKDFIENNGKLNARLKEYLSKNKIGFHDGKIGTVFGIFDMLGSHKLSKEKGCVGVECESAFVLRWCELNDVEAAVILYCSDDPKNKLNKKDERMSNIGRKMRKRLNEIAFEFLARE